MMHQILAANAGLTNQGLLKLKKKLILVIVIVLQGASAEISFNYAPQKPESIQLEILKGPPTLDSLHLVLCLL